PNWAGGSRQPESARNQRGHLYFGGEGTFLLWVDSARVCTAEGSRLQSLDARRSFHRAWGSPPIHCLLQLATRLAVASLIRGADMAESAASMPPLDDDYPLTQDQIDAFRADGFVYLPGVCSPHEVAFYRQAIVRATYAHNTERRPLAERETFRKLALQTMQIRYHDPAVMAFVTARRFGRIAAQLLGVDGVRIYHDQSLFKEPGAGTNITPWHQDLYYWPFDE